MPKRKSQTIAEAIKQTRPFRSRAHEAALSLLRTANVMSRRLDAVTLTEGISGQQYNILRILRGAGEPLPTMEISQRLVEQTPGITGLLDRLEAKGLIRRERGAADRRCVLCQATAQGLKVLGRLDQAVEELDSTGMGTMSEDDWARLIDYLDHIRAELEGADPPARSGRSRK